MKKFLIYFLVTTLSGCSFLSSNNIAPGYTQAFSAIKYALVGYENTAITPQLVEAIPYASSLVRIGKGPYGLMILESQEKNRTTWVTADGVYFVIEKGKIIKTKGLNNNISGMLMPYPFSKSTLISLTKDKSYKYYYSYDFPKLTDLEVSATYTLGDKSTIKLLNQEKELTLIQEELKNDYIGWNVVNNYWIDEDSFVWKSEQHISPRLPKISYEITKKPSI